MASGDWRKWLVASIAVGFGSVGAMGAQGCTVTTGDGPYYGTDAAPGTDSAVPANACNACLFQGCRGQFSVCANAPECIAIYQCAVAPSCVTSGTCVQACYDAHPAGQPAYDALVDCDKIGQCSTCQATCGVAASSCTTPRGGRRPRRGPRARRRPAGRRVRLLRRHEVRVAEAGVRAGQRLRSLHAVRPGLRGPGLRRQVRHRSRRGKGCEHRARPARS